MTDILVLPVKGNIHKTTVKSFKDLQKIVGGLVEIVCVGDPQIKRFLDLYDIPIREGAVVINEEGLIHQLPKNPWLPVFVGNVILMANKDIDEVESPNEKRWVERESVFDEMQGKAVKPTLKAEDVEVLKQRTEETEKLIHRLKDGGTITGQVQEMTIEKLDDLLQNMSVEELETLGLAKKLTLEDLEALGANFKKPDQDFKGSQ